jgi:hypothetical protein
MKVIIALTLLSAVGMAAAAPAPGKPNLSPEALARAAQPAPRQDPKATPVKPDPKAAPAKPEKPDTLIDTKRKAEAGDAKAQVAFAEEFMRMQKYVTAENWLRAAAVQGEPTAIAALAELYEANHGSTTNLIKANPTNSIALYKLAAALGHGKSNFQIGMAYKNGAVVRKDAVRAYAHFKLAEGNREQLINQLVTEMSQDQITAAEKIVADFKPAKFEEAFADLVFDAIHITGIFGGGDRRIAMVNGKQVNAGQQVALLVGGLNAQVKFDEIDSDAVFVSFQSHERKIRPRGSL